MEIKWVGLKSIDETIDNIINVLDNNKIRIYGDFIQDDYVYEYKYDTYKYEHIMNKKKWETLKLEKGVLYESEDNYAGIRDFKASLLFSRNDNDLKDSERDKFVIIFMIAALGFDVYNGKMHKLPKVFNSAISYIKQYGYELNYRSRCCFPFEVKREYCKDGTERVYLEETIIEAISNYTIFTAYGRRIIKYSDEELVMKYVGCSEYELNQYLNMFRDGFQYGSGKTVADEEIFEYVIKKYDLISKYQK